MFSLPVGTEMFHFPTFPLSALYIQTEITGHDSSWVSPFGNPRITARLTAPRGLSQPPTSFIGSQCQGIHHAPLNTYKHKTNIRNCTSENNNYTPPHPQKGAGGTGSLLARCSQPLSTNQTPHTPPPSGATTTHPRRGRDHRRSPLRRGPDKTGTEVTGLLSQSPIVCLSVPSPALPDRSGPVPGKTFVVHPTGRPTTGAGDLLPTTESH